MANISFNIKYIFGSQVDDFGTFINTDFDTPNTNPLELISVLDFGYWVMNKLGIDTEVNRVRNDVGQSIVIKNDAQQIVYQKKTRLNDSMELELVTTIDGQTIVQNLGSNATYDIPSQNVNLPSGTYTISYEFAIDTGAYLCEGSVGIVENHYPIKKWTVTDVINRAFEVVEPLDFGEKPRFRLEGVTFNSVTGSVDDYTEDSLADKLDKILSPEFSFTKMTLREQLQQVGGFIHAEPRVKGVFFENNKPCFQVGFDKYGSNEKAVIKGLKKPVTITLATDINNYATALDSSANNIINQIDFAQGVIYEPFYGGQRTLRTETTTARLVDNDNSFIQTVFPIYSIKGLYAIYDNVKTDITAYVFEQADYGNLSSIAGTYPYSKAYALYYTQGQKNIKGLFFKNPDAVDQATFQNNAILNILRQATGNNNLNIDGQEYFKDLSFEIEYQPLYSTRVRTHKQNIKKGLPSNIVYNQAANIIEGKYYGENLKGTIARLGNVEKFYTYNLAFISDIPKIGTKFDENYYISTVSTEFLPSYIKCTVGLSKDFNRLSEYVGISSNKRMWEVSEKQSQLRDSVINEYLLITDNAEETNDANCFDSSLIQYFINGNNKSMDYPISAMVLKTYSKSRIGTPLHTVTLPTISSAFGNSIAFTCAFEDNYSAGQATSNIVTNNNVSGVWGVNVPYSDYYGRFFWLQCSLIGGNASSDSGPQDLPDGETTSTYQFGANSPKKKYRKDSREIPQITLEFSAVTDVDNLIIGSALANNSCLVRVAPKNVKLYGFTEELNKLEQQVDLSNAVEITGYSIGVSTLTIPQYNGIKAWALVTEPSIQTITVEDENGQVVTQSIQTGGELVLGQNESLAINKTFYFRLKKDIYN